MEKVQIRAHPQGLSGHDQSILLGSHHGRRFDAQTCPRSGPGAGADQERVVGIFSDLPPQILVGRD